MPDNVIYNARFAAIFEEPEVTCQQLAALDLKSAVINDYLLTLIERKISVRACLHS